MPDYTKVTVPKLRELLASRSLPTNGLKTDLIARLTASDAAASSPKPASSSSSTTAAAPPAVAAAAARRNTEEFHVDWEEPAHAAAPAAAPVAISAAGATPAPASAPARAHARAPLAESAPQPAAPKPVRKSIAALFDDPPKSGDAAAHTKTGNEPSSPSTVTSESAPPPPTHPASVAASAPATAATSAAAAPAAGAGAAAAAASDSAQFAANLPTTSLDDEIARRKKRAARFGLSAQESEALKALERQKRFGLHDGEPGDTKISGLDDALPERPQHNQQQQYGRRRNSGGVPAAAGSLRGKRNGHQGAVQTGRVQKPGGGVMLNAEDRRKAEERKRRFAAA